MAKKKQVEVEIPQMEQTVVEAPIVKEKPQPKKNKWEIKDRVYILKGDKRPLSKMIKSANIYWFDKDKGYERE